MFGFKKKIKSVELVSPVNGKMICLKDVPDKVFASEMMGPGVAFISSDGKVYSPCDGELVTVFPTKHALGIKTNNGAELLLHFGLDTVNLEGEGFTLSIPRWRSHPIHENRATESICTEPCNPLLRATKSMKRATSTY